MSLTVLGFISAVSLGGCGSSQDSTRTAAATGPGPASGNGTGTGGADATGRVTPTATGTASATATVASTGTVSTTDTGSGTSTGTDVAAAGRAYFAATVVPLFEARCSGCHADPRIQVAERGPLTIFSYDSMKALLSTGGAPDSSGLYDKVRSITSHTGGDQCGPTADAASPCKEVIAWWHAEFGAGTPGAGSLGMVTSVSALGEVYGYASDPTSTATAVSVTLYADGAKGTGTSLGTVAASAAGASGGVAGNHAFTFQLPATLEDGKLHQLYAYVVLSGTEEPLTTPETPTPFQAWTFSAAGRSYYTATVQPLLSACAGCHTVSYEQQYYSLIAPSPAGGGTALNNQLLNKASETNSTTHGGGLRCATPQASPCAQFQAWWKIEFGG